MTFVSVADACRRLGIDAKTLRSFLAEAQLSLHSHPHDGRKKGMSGEHLQVLARLHQRSLVPLSQEPPAPLPGEVPPLPAALLALPETLGVLQTQIAALRASVADLTRLLQQHAQEPASSTALPPQTRASKRPPKPASPAPHSRPAASVAAKPPPKPAHIIPRGHTRREG
jgi:hypothetical protein